MAKTNNSILLQSFRGQIGKQIVVKQYGKKTVLAAYPNMPKFKKTPLRELYEKRFKEAVAYAQEVMGNDDLKKEYEAKLREGQKVFNYVISEYLKRIKEKEGPKFGYY